MQSRDHMHILYRMNAPTEFCYEPYTTQWRIKRDDGTEVCFIQTSTDEAKPNWLRYSDLLERCMHNKLEDIEFMHNLLLNYSVDRDDNA